MNTIMFKNMAIKTTPVSNVFIEKYMIRARGEFVKVYLLTLRYCMSGEPGINSTMLASALHLLETDVMNALSYWNDEGVIRFVPVDNLGNFSVEFLDLEEDPTIKPKEVNLLEELTNNATKDMLQEIEKLLARPLSSKEITIYIGWQKDFSFSLELILLIIEYCVSKGKTDFRYIEKVAIGWYDAKVKNIEDAQILIRKNEDKWVKFRKILSYLGVKDPEIMKPQEDLLDKWVNIMSFDVNIIFKACDICFERLGRADFKYIDAILTSWHKDNIKTLEDVALKGSKKNSNYKKNFNNSKQSVDNFNNFEQRNYDYDSLEKKLLGWDK